MRVPIARVVLSLVLVAGAATVFTGPTAGPFQDQPTPAAREEAYAVNNRGVARLEQYLCEDAAAAFEQALALAPDLGTARLNLALARLYANEPDRAVVEARRARESLPASPRPHYVLGLALRLQNEMDAAAAAFEEVLRLDASDVGSLVHLGQVRVQQRRFDEAVALFRRAVDEEPFNVTAAYNLAVALTRSGARAEGQSAMERFQQLRDSAYAVTYSAVYLEQGKYAEAIASTGAEPDIVDERLPAVRFVDATSDLQSTGLGPLRSSVIGRRIGAALLAPDRRRELVESVGGGVTLADLDRDGDLDLLVAEPDGLRLLENDGRGRLSDVTSRRGFAAAPDGLTVAAVAADYDNDGRPDVLELTLGGARLWHQETSGTFQDVTAGASLPAYPHLARTAAFLDADHDGDLDILIAGLASLDGGPQAVGEAGFPDGLPPAPLQLVRNNGNGSFTDITVASALAVSAHAVAVAPSDFDNRRDIDIVLAAYGRSTALLKNVRDGTFEDVAMETGLPVTEPFASLAAADVNKDGYTDLFIGRVGAPGLLASSDGRGRFEVSPAPRATADAVAAQFVDYDNDGLLDLFVLGETGPAMLRNTGRQWVDASGVALLPLGDSGPRRYRALAMGDLDGDGDADAIVRDLTGVRIWRNEGQTNRALVVRLESTVSNRSALGAKVEVRAGSLWQKLETSAAAPPVAPAGIVFGIGSRLRADVVRVLWPAGILQAEIDPQAAAGDANTGLLTITELNRKPSSCPYLYTWNGTRFEFITDFMGGGEMGAWVAPGLWNAPDPDEYVRIAGEHLRPRNGRYEVRVTNELEEALFVDRLELIAVDHPVGVEVHPNEGLLPPPRPPFKLHVVADARPPESARDTHGHDVLDRLTRVDRRYPDEFSLTAVRGYAEPHDLVLDLGPPPSGDADEVLLLTGWTDYAFSGDNVAAHQAGLTMVPPRIDAQRRDGRWVSVAPNIGFPVGRPQTIVVELGRQLAQTRRIVRISTTMRIYWDEIRVGAAVRPDGVSVRRLAGLSAELGWRGFSAEVSPEGLEPFAYDYARVSATSLWKTMVGAYTREGDVTPLLASSDDMFVVSKPGDEIALSFDGDLGGPDPGMARTFLLYSDGFSKEMDLRSSDPDLVGPLPFHAMSGYPYGSDERYPETPAHREYLDRYNTRVVPRAIPSIDAHADAAADRARSAAR